MIEIRCAYELTLRDVESDAVPLWRRARQELFPELKWQGRVQQMLMGQTQQCTFAWVTIWEDYFSWEKAYSQAQGVKEFKQWLEAVESGSLRSGQWTISQIIEPFEMPEFMVGQIEIQSSYIVPGNKLSNAAAVMSEGLEDRVLQGYCTQRLFGTNAKSLFSWSSFWNSFSEWEKVIFGLTGDDLNRAEAWFSKWVNEVDIGGPREVFRLL